MQPLRGLPSLRASTKEHAMHAALAHAATADTNAPFSPSLVAAGGIRLDELRRHANVTQRKLGAGQHLYRAGQPFNSLFLVQAGFLKTSLVAEDGREQVTGFRSRGDLLGVESIGTQTHACFAVALDACVVWELPYPAILKAVARMPELQAQFTAALAAEIRSDRNWMLALGTLAAEQRVAAFLLDVAERHQALGFSARHFVLRMSRADIGSFLALKHETVTRALTRLSAQGCIQVQLREVRIFDADALRACIRQGACVH
jgi:CRP/FNR family transcriptional regulator, anaerobic regulatory protein